MVLWSWWIGLAEDECIAARVESCQEGLAGCQPSVPAQVDLISHRQACQLAFTAVRGWGARHGVLRAPPPRLASAPCPLGAAAPARGMLVGAERASPWEGRREALGDHSCYEMGAFICDLINRG